MPESSDALLEIKKLRSEVDQQGEMLDALVRYDPRVRDSILDEFKGDKVLATVYLLIDGAKTQQQIVESAKSLNIKGASAPMITRKITLLRTQMRVITPVAKDGRSWIYAHNRLGRALSLTKNIRKMHNLDVQ
jgi:hypothetical protein